MKRALLMITVLLAILLTACGAQATPTTDPAQIQASAVAAANTMVAMTQAAIPTETPSPQPSPTVLPSPTPLPLPTLETTAVAFPTAVPPTAASGTGADNCLHPLDMGEAGPTHPTVIKNHTGGTLNLSLNLYKKNLFGQCGSMSYANVGKNATINVGLPSGYWFAYAWANAKGKQFTVGGSFYVQPANMDKMEVCLRSSGVAVYAQSCQ